MGVSKNRGKTPQIIHLFIGIGTIIFTIHFGGSSFPPIFASTPIYCQFVLQNPLNTLWILSIIGMSLPNSGSNMVLGITWWRLFLGPGGFASHPCCFFFWGGVWAAFLLKAWSSKRHPGYSQVPGIQIITLPETNSQTPLKMMVSNRTLLFQGIPGVYFQGLC